MLLEKNHYLLIEASQISVLPHAVEDLRCCFHHLWCMSAGKQFLSNVGSKTVLNLKSKSVQTDNFNEPIQYSDVLMMKCLFKPLVWDMSCIKHFKVKTIVVYYYSLL